MAAYSLVCLLRRENMKICICSDSHGNAAGLARMLACERPDALLFMGDGLRDVDTLSLPEGLHLAAVAGNCDLAPDAPLFQVIRLAGHTFYMTHGHRDGVKWGLGRLAKAARAAGADVALYGHTHTANEKMLGGVRLLCPGAMKDPECRYLVLHEKNGALEAVFKTLDV
jgi:putative phosphoesterase